MALDDRYIARWSVEASEAVPADYARIKDGLIEDDDLVWDFMGKRFLRNDSPEWTDAKPATVDGLIYVIRSIRIKPTVGQAVRTYKMKRG